MRYRRFMESKVGNTCQPKRIIFYRGEFKRKLLESVQLDDQVIDGVSEGQFQQVIDMG